MNPMYAEFYSQHIRNPKLRGSQIDSNCPFHDDRHASFSVNVQTGLWKCHAGCGDGNARQFAERLGVEDPTENGQGTKREVVARYIYRDDHGHPLFRVCRTTPKGFFQESYDGVQWVNGLQGVRRVLYRLPEILKAPVVYIVEGEKDADRLWSMGIPATCNPGGAGKWREEYSESLTGKKAVVIPDNDDPGEDHGFQVARSLLPFAKAVKVVSLPGLGPRKEKHGEDISDWLDAGHSKGELAEAVTSTPLVDPEISFPHYREQTVRKEIKLQTWVEFLSTTPEEREYTINGILPDSGLVVLLGRGKHGKSTLAIHVCRAVGSGLDFLGKQTKKKPVIYVNYEMAEDYLQTLLRSGDCPNEAYLVSRPEAVLSLGTIESLITKVENGPGIMVIDSFRGAFKLQGEAENSAGGAGVVLRNIQDLAVNTGWLILLIHHRNRSNKDGTDGVSGTSDWIAAPDVLWSWSRPDPDKNGTLIIEGRIPPLDPMAVQLSLENCEYVGTVKEDQEKTDKEAIQAVLTEDWQIPKDIVALTGLPEGTVRTRLNSLHKDGLIERGGKGVSKNPYKWRKVVSAQDNPLSAETNNGEANEVKEGDQCQTLEL